MMISTIAVFCVVLVAGGSTTGTAHSNEAGGPVIKALTAPVILGEGPHWDAAKRVLYFVDIAEKKVYQYDPRTTKLTFVSFDEPVGAVFPVQNTTDRFYVGVGKTLTEVMWNGENTTRPWIRKVHTANKDDGHRFNDGKVDSAGTLWFGTQGKPNAAALYKLSKDTCQLEPVLKNITYSNGIIWSQDDKHMFYIDTLPNQVMKYDYDLRDGSIKNGRVLIDFTKENITGGPDGMTMDSNGDLWIGCYGGSQVVRVDSHTGKLLARIKMPVPIVTSVVFGDDSYQTLYVTTARTDLSDAELQKFPLSGALFSVSNLNVTGRPSNAVAGCVF